MVIGVVHLAPAGTNYEMHLLAPGYSPAACDPIVSKGASPGYQVCVVPGRAGRCRAPPGPAGRAG